MTGEGGGTKFSEFFKERWLQERENTCRCVRSLDSEMRMRDSRFPEDLTQFSLVLHYRHQKLVHFVKRYFALLDARLEDVYRVIN